MTKWYNNSRSAQCWRQLALAALLATGATAAQAQTLNYGVAGASNVAGTYTDLGTTGTTLITTANTDDANSAATPIGFNFSFNGTTFTDFVLNTNGLIRLGTAAPSSAAAFPPYAQAAEAGPISGTNAADVNLIAPFNLDLGPGTGGTTEYRVSTTGAPGSRVCTIQWKNVSDKPQAASSTVSTVIATQLANFSFQVKLTEGTNNIEFVYGPSVAGTGTAAAKYAAVGIKGSAPTASVLATKASTGAWATTTFLAGPYVGPAAGNAHNVRQTFLADVGRTYRFQPSFANDASVQAIYSMGKLPIPFAVPHTIQAVIRNVGTTAMANVSVVASAPTGGYSSTKTIAALAVGASTTVTFDPYSPTTTATQAVTVTLGNDGNASNNVKTYQQQINTTTFAYSQPGVPAVSSIGFNAGSGILANKYNTNAARSVNSVVVRLEDPNSVGKTVYGVVTDATGTIVGRSANYVILAADISADHTFTLTTPAAVAAGDFYAGLAQTVGSAGYFPVGNQAEDPSRLGVTYSIPLAGGTPADQGAANLGLLMIEAVTSAPPTCLAPSAVTVTGTTATTASITFTGPANGTGYTLIYGAPGFNPATAGTSLAVTGSPYTIPGLTSSTTYEFYIRANCGGTDQSTLAGPFTFSTACVAPIITTFPYTENFDGVAAGALPCGVTVLDVNNDAKTWQVINSNPASAPNSMRYSYSTANAADDWFFTPALFLRAGSRYQLQFKYRAFGFTEKLEVKYGTAATVAAMTSTIFQNANIISTTYATTVSGTTAGQVAAIAPTANGNVFIGFHAYSAADQFNLYVDDISISVVTGTSAALDRSISVFPNPSTGIVTLDIRGANAKGAMQVEVTNMLGQTMRTASVSDNQLNKLDLSTLAAGVYTLKVKSGADYSIRQLVIQK